MERLLFLSQAIGGDNAPWLLTERDTMTSASGTPSSVDATTALLQEELPRLEAHQQSLEKELAAVTERLESVRSALTALQVLSVVPHVLEEAQEEGTPPGGGKQAAEERSKPSGRAAKPAKKAAAKKGSAARPAKSAAKEAPQDEEKDHPSGLTRQVLEVLADAKGGTVRARDVAKVLGRDGSPGDINAVRSTLDRLVATSRADRAGRGLYTERS